MTSGMNPLCICPWCGTAATESAAIDGDDTPPKPGDLSICLICGNAVRFAGCAGLLVMEKLSDEEFKALDDEIKVQLHNAQLLVQSWISK